MSTISFRWLLRPQKTWVHFQQVSIGHFSIFLTGVFLLFSVIGFYRDLIAGGTQPYALVLTIAVYAGLDAVLWVVVLARLPMVCTLGMVALEVFVPTSNYLAHLVRSIAQPPAVAPESGIHFAATAILLVVIASYNCFSVYIGIAGREAFRIRTELALAHSIQKTLVPPVNRITRCFEIYGISMPSEKVGGDLVDVVELAGGDTVAYLADIAGHGLQAGILMGMLKTAARTALAGGRDEPGGAVLSELMQTLNQVLPQVKEAHMFATFTALRLNENGLAYYGMAASPPLLHWSAAGKSMSCTEEQQFPLGLLPVADFPSGALAMEPGDLAVIATDGILEVNSTPKSGGNIEFGTEALERLVAKHAALPLEELATAILKAVRGYGKQIDDQTLLLVRRR